MRMVKGARVNRESDRKPDFNVPINRRKMEEDTCVMTSVESAPTVHKLGRLVEDHLTRFQSHLITTVMKFQRKEESGRKQAEIKSKQNICR